ncbi:MAG: quinone-dependent dihydroorotate dehydrogenase [Marinilabiliales bacterium]|nr:MAG: quinone-dependent dihydroorotate dehydrogenase [Marinilabiliales bacterium]
MLYRLLLRPFLFLFYPETVHSIAVGLLKLALMLPGITPLFRKLYFIQRKSLERTVFGIRFRNPVGIAAGFDKNAQYCNELAMLGFSFVEIGTVTPLAQPGNPRPRSFRLPEDQALINRMGINNEGAVRIAENLRKTCPDVVIGGNIGKNTSTPNDKAIDDYIECFKVLYEVVDYFVVNVSCPNIGDIRKLQDADTLFHILSSLKEISKKMDVIKPILLKISPDLNDSQLDELVDIAFRTGIDGFVATNTTIRRDNLHTDHETVAAMGQGGLSGKPLRDRSTEIIRYIVRKSEARIPVIGVGGIMDEKDALEKLDAGASLIQVYTGFIYGGPGIAKRINRAIASCAD